MKSISGRPRRLLDPLLRLYHICPSMSVIPYKNLKERQREKKKKKKDILNLCTGEKEALILL